MGAKVGNIGGGMVELFSWDVTGDTEARIIHNLTSEELSAILTECERYNVFIFSVEAHYNYGGKPAFSASSGIATTKTMADFLNATVGTIQRLYVINGDANSSVIKLTKQTDGLHIIGGFQVANVTDADVTLKIYGLIL